MSPSARGTKEDEALGNNLLGFLHGEIGYALIFNSLRVLKISNGTANIFDHILELDLFARNLNIRLIILVDRNNLLHNLWKMDDLRFLLPSELSSNLVIIHPPGIHKS